MSIIKHGSTFHLHRVPHTYRAAEPREIIWRSLHTDPATVIRSKADRA